ncbi:MAG: type II toxin-antitoxin system PemK/MazF family toxin [Bergeyella sp.]
MNINQFEIWIADLNPNFGTEAGKVRPVLVIQTNLLNEIGHPSTLVCPITTNVQNAEFLRVNIPEKTCGLNENCDVMIDQIRSIDNKRFLKKVGNLSQTKSKKVKQNLKIVLDLE